MVAEFGVIFDMDGVLVNSYESHLKTWQECCRRHGRDCTEAEFLAGFGRTSREVIRDTWTNPPDDAGIAAFDEEKEQAWRELISQDFPHMPGADDLIRSLADAGIPMAIGSSGPPGNVAAVAAQLHSGHAAALAAGARCLGVVSRGRRWEQLEGAHDRVLNDLQEVTVARLRRIVNS